MSTSDLDINNSLIDLSLNINNLNLNYRFADDVLTNITLQQKINDISNVDISNLLFKLDQLQLLLTNIQHIDISLNNFT